MKSQKLSNQTYIGTKDIYGDSMQIINYIFNTWRKVCRSFNYEEYLTPLVEYAQIYKAKSGEEIASKELYELKDKSDRELAIRPEMTPSVARLVTKFYNTTVKPIRMFSIANFMRYEKPQKGRLREFWQLNYDIFGAKQIEADIEILTIALEIMFAFNAPKGSFSLFINHRQLLDDILDEIVGKDNNIKRQVSRILDKFKKISKDVFIRSLKDLGLNDSQIDLLYNFMVNDPAKLENTLPFIKKSAGLKKIKNIIEILSSMGYSDYIKFSPHIIRGFDYYNGMIFEVFDNNPDNPRALFGGGRYNGLTGLFGMPDIPAVGAAPGNVTMEAFLKGWNLLPKNLNDQKSLYIPQLLDNKIDLYYKLAKLYRSQSYMVELGLDIQSIAKALRYADKKDFNYVLILAEDEFKKGNFKIKDLKTGKETSYKIKI